MCSAVARSRDLKVCSSVFERGRCYVCGMPLRHDGLSLSEIMHLQILLGPASGQWVKHVCSGVP